MNKWYESAVFYHIYPLGLCGAPKVNQPGVEEHRLRELFHWIDHIKSLSCNAIYIGPLFESIGHGYETTDYKLVDRRLGDNDDFREFVNICHDNNIKVVVDGVFNHTGRDFFAFQDIILKRDCSEYKDWYCNVNFHGNNEYNDGFSYAAWGGYNLLPKLNLKNTAVKNYIYQVIQYWVEEFDIDGIRLDAADVLDFDFMRELRKLADTIKLDFWLMGEVIHGDYSNWVNDNMLHSVTNYELHKGLYSGHNDHNYFEIAHTIRRLFDAREGLCKGCRLYTFVDNHDVERLASKLLIKEHLIPVYILLYTLPGIPSIYYGSEFAIEGKKEKQSDDSLRPAIDLDNFIPINGRKYEKICSLIAKLGDIKKNNNELSHGEFQQLLLTNRQYAFGRILDDNAVITVVNNDNNPIVVNIDSPLACEQAYDIFEDKFIPVVNNKLEVQLQGNDGKIIKIKRMA